MNGEQLSTTSRESTARVELRQRTKEFALRVIRLCAALPRRIEGQVIGRQLLGAGTSVGAHYREAHRARSTAEFVSKMEGGLQELDETTYWLELVAEAGLVSARRLASLQDEAQQLMAIFVASVRTAKRRPRR
jgi:four helix bundle protein